MVAQALPFETIPDEPLRAHFTKWLAQSLTNPPQPAEAPGPALARSDAAPPARTTADPLPLAELGSEVSSRPQFVRSRDGTVWVTRPILRSRGWTDAAVRDFLPEPEGLKPNPRFAATGSPMPVWRPPTVAAAEAAPEWREWLERSLRRRRTTLEALAETEDEDFRARLERVGAAIDAEGAPTPTHLEQ